jgi:cytochrome c peroxidase
MKGRILLVSTVLLSLFWLAACQVDSSSSLSSLRPKLPDTAYDYSLKMPPEFGPAFFQDSFIIIDFIGGIRINQANPPITNEGATLGRVLFYDPQLSINNRISCGSCHKQNLAFSDDVVGSEGFGGKITPRNSMAIVNAVLNHNLFWDSRSGNVLDLVTKPIQNHIEMGMENMEILEQKLGKVDYYPDLFQKAFGSPAVTKDAIANALAQFVCAITTVNSRFDQQKKVDFAGMTTLEKMGKELFFSSRTNCARCHAEPNFAAPDFPGGEYGGGFNSSEDLKGTANNGLDLVFRDQGLGNGKFRIPSLRNIALTAPYMHDGRFKTLEEVVDFYSHGVQAHAHLDKNLRNADGSPLRPQLNALEKEAMLAFLNTLTDPSMLADPKYSDPFAQ